MILTDEKGSKYEAKMVESVHPEMGQGCWLKPIKKKTGWERAERYYSIQSNGHVAELGDNSPWDSRAYNFGNYFTDKALCEETAKEISLFLRLKRFRDEHDTGESGLWYILYDNYFKETNQGLLAQENCNPEFGCVYFTTREVCEQAIKTFKEELIWYFTRGK